MGLIRNGTSFSGSVAGRLFGATAALGAISSLAIRGRVPFQRFTSVDSYPIGLGFAALVPAMKSGGIAGRAWALGSAGWSLSGLGELSGPVVAAATTLASPNLGLQISGSALGLGTVSVNVAAVGALSGLIRIGANPSAVDISGELLDVQRVGSLSLRQSLALLSGLSNLSKLDDLDKIEKKINALIGLSV